MKRVTQDAGRKVLGDFAPDFAHFNDDILFGENWNNRDIDLKMRSIVTMSAIISQGLGGEALKHHMQNAKNNGVSKDEAAAIITHIAFYAGWPKAWAAFHLAKEAWGESSKVESSAAKGANLGANRAANPSPKDAYAATIFFPIGEPNDAYKQYFTGRSYIAPLSKSQVKMANVTFEPKCRNNWHIHRAKSGGGQMLIAVGGRGYYQEWGKAPVELLPGDVVNIPANVKHWHGAAKDSWFSHIAVTVEGVETSNEWLERVSDEDYGRLR